MTKSTRSKSKASSASLSNLATPLTRFIGRQRETAQVRRLISTTRWVTLTGASGCGKTRLALNVAAGLQSRFPDGFAWVELGPLGDPTLVAPTVVKALGLRERSNQRPAETLIHFLRPKKLLLVLDDCDRLIPACAALVESLLADCPDLHILCTSREALGHAGEAAWLVPSLSIPEAFPASHTAEERVPILGRSDAIELFVDRASSVLPTFHLTPENADAVLEVCRRLDGIPLAIELAASRVKVLTVQQIAARLDHRFNLLTAGINATLPRHQTLREAIDWSHDLLPDPERVLFRRLAVFAGGWTLDAAEAVCADARGAEISGPAAGVQDRALDDWPRSPSAPAAVPQTEVLNLLTHLIDKSLVVAETQRGSEARYHLLDTMQEYAAEKMAAAGETAAVRSRHRDWFLEFAEQVETESRGANQKIWFDRAELEHDNLRAALKACAETGAVEAELRIAAALSQFWIVRGFLREGREWLERALPESGRVPDPVRAKALHVTGTLISRQGEYDAARPFLERALALRRELGDPRAISISLNNLASVAINQGNYARARELLEESIAIKRKLGDKTGLAYSLGNLGEVARHEGDYAQAAAYYEESLALLRELDNRETVAMVLFSLGSLHQAREDDARATEFYREGLTRAQAAASKWAIAMCIAGLAGIARTRGELERAARLLGAAEAQLEAIGSPLEPADRAEYENSVAALRAQLNAETFRRAWAQGRALTVPQAIEQALQDEPRRTKEEPTSAVAFRPPPSAELRLLALGAMRAYRGERELTGADFAYAKSKELLFFLLCHPPQTREQIGLALWPEASPAQLRNNLGVHLYHLRRALGRPEWIIFENERYVFNRALAYWFDLEMFQAHLAEAARAKADQAAKDLAEAIQLYHGDLCPDVSAEWVLPLRAETQRRYLDALLRLGQLRLDQARFAEAAEVYHLAITQDGYLEEAHRGLMRCYARQGELSQVLRHYRMFVDLMRNELGGEPAAETRELFERLRRGERA